MKSLTQLACTGLTLILAFACHLSFASTPDDLILEKDTQVSEVLLPLSGKEIKMHTAGPKRGTSMKQVEAKFGKAMKYTQPRASHLLHDGTTLSSVFTLNQTLSSTQSAAQTDQHRLHQ